MTARLTQLIARYLAVVFTAGATWLGASDAASAKVSDLSSTLAAAIVAILLFGIDLVMHKVATGGVLKTGGQGVEGTRDQGTKGSGKSGLLLLVLFAGCLVGGVAGCVNHSPMQRVMSARQTYTDTLQALIPLRQAGIIDDAEARKIEAIRVQVADGLDAAEAAAMANDAAGTGNALDQVNALLDRLIAMQKAEGAKGPGDQGIEGKGQETRKGLAKPAKSAKSAEGEKSGNTDGAD